MRAMLTLNSFKKGKDGGGPSECDNAYHSDDEKVVGLSTGWLISGMARCSHHIKITANGNSVYAKAVDECDSVHGSDEDHNFEAPCANNIIDTSPRCGKPWHSTRALASRTHYNTNTQSPLPKSLGFRSSLAHLVRPHPNVRAAAAVVHFAFPLPALPFKQATYSSTAQIPSKRPRLSSPSPAKPPADGRDLLSSLPGEMLEEILRRLNIDEARPAAVDSVLAAYASRIGVFSLQITEESYGKADGWIRALAAKGVRSLKLFFFRYPQELGVLPAPVFSCSELTTLELECCHMPPVPSDFRGFPHLLHLKLREIHTRHPKTLEAIISMSPSLTFLCIAYLHITSNNDDGTFDEWVINAPNVKGFEIRSDEYGEAHGCSIENLDSLEEAHVAFVGPRLVRMLSGMRKVQKLCIDLQSDHVILERQPSIFWNLTNLRIWAKFDQLPRIVDTLRLLKSAPKLENLWITIIHEHDEDIEVDMEFTYTQWVGLFSRLKCVRLDYIQSDSNEMQFIEFLLLEARKLQKIEISVHELSSMSMEDVSGELSNYGKASSQAELIITPHGDLRPCRLLHTTHVASSLCPGAGLNTTASMRAMLTLNSFKKGKDGGGPSECDNAYHSDDEKVVGLSTGWLISGMARCSHHIKITANGNSVYAKAVDECDSVHGSDEDHNFEAPCANNIIDTSPRCGKPWHSTRALASRTHYNTNTQSPLPKSLGFRSSLAHLVRPHPNVRAAAAVVHFAFPLPALPFKQATYSSTAQIPSKRPRLSSPSPAKPPADGRDLLSSLPGEMLEEILRRLNIDEARPAAVDSVLAAYASRIGVFSLQITEESYGKADGWIRALAAKGVRSLKLFFFRYPQELGVLPAPVFSCSELTTLELECCHMPPVPSDFRGFPHLLHLKLREIHTRHPKTLEAIISMSPSLTFLCIAYLHITSNNDDGTFDEWVINAPNVKGFEIRSDEYGEAHGCSIENLDSLEEAHVAFVGPRLVRMLSGMRKVQKLCIDLQSDHVILERQPSIFWNLTNLRIWAKFDQLPRIVDTLRLLKSAPKLENLWITIIHEHDEDIEVDMEFTYTQWVGLFSRLKCVRLDYIQSDSNEMQFIEFLLLEARKLQKIEISVHELSSMSMEDVSGELSNYGKASSQAELIITPHGDLRPCRLLHTTHVASSLCPGAGLNTTASMRAMLTLNSFKKGKDGGGPSECDNAYHSDDEKVVGLSTGWLISGMARCSHHIKITANGNSVYAKAVDECDSVHGSDEDHNFEAPCANNIIDTSPRCGKPWHSTRALASRTHYNTNTQSPLPKSLGFRSSLAHLVRPHPNVRAAAAVVHFVFPLPALPFKQATYSSTAQIPSKRPRLSSPSPAKPPADGRDLLSSLPGEMLEEILRRLNIDEARPAAVDSVLAAYASRIGVFSLQITEESYGKADGWIRALAAKGVRSLKLFFFRYPQELGVLPAPVFSCSELTTLELECCHMPPVPSDFRGFPHLLHLKLREIHTRHPKTLEAIISMSPSLTFLCIAYLHITSNNDDGTFDEWVINAPNVKGFEIRSDEYGEAHGCSIENLDSLEEAHVAFVGPRLVRMLSGMRKVQKLCIDLQSDHVILERQPSIFWNLTNLRIWAKFDQLPRIVDTLRLLKSAPKLENLWITIIHEHDEDIEVDMEFTYTQWVGLFSRLKCVRLDYIQSDSNEMQFIEFLLLEARKLQKIEISVHELSSMSMEDVSGELSNYGKASSQAELIITPHGDLRPCRLLHTTHVASSLCPGAGLNTTASMRAMLTLNSFKKDKDGGGPSECDNAYHSDDEKVVGLSTGWLISGMARCSHHIKITANGNSVYAKAVDECDSVHGSDEDHNFEAPCANNIIDTSPRCGKPWHSTRALASRTHYNT
ncbi:hypothetical protein EJB05_54603, partial [Eragrostis curvula]